MTDLIKDILMAVAGVAIGFVIGGPLGGGY